ncbi:Aste57867_24283 [Aphanomyces stellatus]|uniref:Aste57867_24283 protein n=1 Tax=Aphanomyces stellatus TaxID=120398 RepID=A0A485LQ34_9STRA|nr:hypothetical protein As57867_024208 [Aphanomyces stellatus]VFU00923.1 Aste57867_24283 [Aphanomyces stellatus]
MFHTFLTPMAFGGLDLIDDDIELIDTDVEIMDIEIDGSIVIDWDYLDEICPTRIPGSASVSPFTTTQPRVRVPTLSPSSKTPQVHSLPPLPHSRLQNKAMQAKKKSSKKAAKPCTIPDCPNKARTRGVCKAYGGAKRCPVSGCNTCTVGGLFCIKHNGGKRCLHPGTWWWGALHSRWLLTKQPGWWSLHGSWGGKRCTVASCSKTAQYLGRCSKHALERIDDGDDDDDEHNKYSV